MEDQISETAAEEINRAIDQAVEQGSRRRKRTQTERTKARANAADYEPAIVSFIDVLGFRSMLATRGAREIHDVVMSLREFSAPNVTPARRMKEVRVMSRAFAESVSDAVVRVRVFNTPYSEGQRPPDMRPIEYDTV